MSGNRAERHVPAKQSTHDSESPAAQQARYVEASNVLSAAADVLQNKRATSIKDQPATDLASLWMLLAAASGQRDGTAISGADRRALLNAAMATLVPAMKQYGLDGDQRDWLADNVQAPLDDLERDLQFAEAEERVHDAVLLPGNHVVDAGDDGHPRQQAQALHEAIPALIETLRMLNEQIIGLHEEAIEEEVERILAGHHAEGVKAGSLVELGNALSVIDGYLILSDDELKDRLHELDGFTRASTIAELVKGVTMFVGGVLGVTTSTVGLIARAAGEVEIAQACSGLSRGVGLKVGHIVMWIEAAHSFATLLDSRSTRGEKIDASVGLATSATGIASKYLPTIAGASTLAVSTAATLGYAELKLSLQLYWGAAEGLVAGLMAPAFQSLRDHGLTIAGYGNEVIKAQGLIDGEQVPERREALQRVLTVAARDLGSAIDSLIAEIAPVDLEAGMARHAGAYKILVDALAPVRVFHGVRAPESAMLGASVALGCLHWVRIHEAEIAEAAASHHGIADVKEPSKESGDAHE